MIHQSLRTEYKSKTDFKNNISELLRFSDYKRMPVADVSLSQDGLLLGIDDGEKIDGVYYPKGYRVLVKIDK